MEAWDRRRAAAELWKEIKLDYADVVASIDYDRATSPYYKEIAERFDDDTSEAAFERDHEGDYEHLALCQRLMAALAEFAGDELKVKPE